MHRLFIYRINEEIELSVALADAKRVKSESRAQLPRQPSSEQAIAIERTVKAMGR